MEKAPGDGMGDGPSDGVGETSGDRVGDASGDDSGRRSPKVLFCICEILFCIYKVK